MRKSPLLRLGVAAAALSLVATGCGGGGSDDEGDGDQTGGTLRAYASEPDNLLPTNVTDVMSSDVIKQVYNGLVTYNDETGEAEMDVAESIESDDNITWTVTLKDSYEFTNGEPVNADAFMRAWSYAANSNNTQAGAYFMSRIKGYDELQEEKGVAKDATLSGLTKVDDYTFTVELTEPFVGFPETVGYTSYMPLAEECLADAKACAEKPIGNGRYVLDGEWQHNQQITLVRNDDYAGDDAGIADTIEFVIFDEIEAGYAAFQGGEVDIIDTVPPEEVGNVETEYPDTSFQQPSDSFTYLGFPNYDKRFENPDLRKAISMAIDRDAIVEAIFDGAFTSASGWVSPNFEGFREGVCEACEYNPDEAKKLFDQAGGFEGKLQLWANGGSGHEEWLQAVGDQLNKNLGIDYELKTQITDFGQYLEKASGHDMPGPFRGSWLPDYPVLETYLSPIYGSGGSSNYTGYENKEFDAAVSAGNAADDLDGAIASYQEAEDILAEDMPSAPLYWGMHTVIWSDAVSDITFNPIMRLDLGQVSLN